MWVMIALSVGIGWWEAGLVLGGMKILGIGRNIMRAVLLMVISCVLTGSGFSEASEYDALPKQTKKLVNAAFYMNCKDALESENADEILLVAMLLNDRETTLAYSDKELAEKKKTIIKLFEIASDSNLYDISM